MTQVDDEPQLDSPGGAGRARPRARRSGGVLLPVLLAVLAVLAVGAGAGAYYYFNLMMAPAVVAEPAPVAGTAPPAASAAATATPPAPSAQTGATAAPLSQPPEGAKLSAERFEGWFVVCPEGQPNSPTCFVQQQLHSAESNALVFMWIMRRDAEGVIHSVWQTPPGLDVARGMLLDAGDGTPHQVPIADCQPSACTVRGVFAPAYLATLASASRVTATITLRADGRALRYAFDPRGMQAALDRLAGTAAAPAPTAN